MITENIDWVQCISHISSKATDALGVRWNLTFAHTSMKKAAKTLHIATTTPDY